MCAKKTQRDRNFVKKDEILIERTVAEQDKKEKIDEEDEKKFERAERMFTNAVLKDGKEAIFIRLKQKKFIAKINGQAWDIGLEYFDKVLEEAKDNLEYRNLKKGELFYISNNGNAELFKFDSIKIVSKKEKIMGINPITGGTHRIDASMYVGKISDIK
jgi:uncharacterized protein YjhX (UPF0386 family)